MAKIIDRTGERFGKLTILEELGGNKVIARCDCGSIKKYVKGSLITGNTSSCSCKKSEVLTSRLGQKFSSLTVVQELGKNRVIARCDCGSIKEYVKSNLVSDRTKSCGCDHVRSIVGEEFGRLTVTKELRGGRVTAKCTCGKLRDYSKASIVRGNTNSCGCIKSGRKLKSVVGEVFNSLTVTKELGLGKVQVRCICGTVKEYRKSSVVSGNTKSCGCLRRRKAHE